MTDPRPYIRVAVATVLVLGIALGPQPARAAKTPQRCASLKLDAAARAIVAHLGCHARAASNGGAVRPACLAHVDGMFETAFQQAEARGGCAFVGDAPAVDIMIDDVVGDLVAALAYGPPHGRCAAAKLRAAGRRAFGELACRRRAVKLNASVDPECQARAAARLVLAFGHAERRLACGSTGDAGALQTMLGGLATQVATRIVSGSGNPAPSSLTAVIAGGQIQLTWVAPEAASGNTYVRVLRRLNTAPVDATDQAATPIFFGTAEAASDDLTALLPDTTETARTYHYAVFGCTKLGVCETTGSRATLTPTLVQALRAGGYVLHWRHSAATVCQDQTGLGTAATTMTPNWWKSCNAQCPPAGMATARQLDATGVADATTIGAAFDARGIPIGRVLSSEFCRNVTTAQLMDFGPLIEQRQDLTFFVYDEAARCTNSYARIAEVPAAGTNTAIIGHAGFVCPVLQDLAWSEAAIFKPDGGGGSELVTRVVVNAWAGLP